MNEEHIYEMLLSGQCYITKLIDQANSTIGTLKRNQIFFNCTCRLYESEIDEIVKDILDNLDYKLNGN